MDNFLKQIFKNFDISKNSFYSKIEYLDENSCIVKKQNNTRSTYLEIKEIVEILDLLENTQFTGKILKNNDILIRKNL